MLYVQYMNMNVCMYKYMTGENNNVSLLSCKCTLECLFLSAAVMTCFPVVLVLGGREKGTKNRTCVMERPERAGALLWSGRIPLGSSCDRRNRFRKSSCCSLQHSEEMKRKKARGWRGWGGGREGKSERQREGNRNKFLSNQFVSPLRRSAEEDKLLCLARSASSTA